MKTINTRLNFSSSTKNKWTHVNNCVCVCVVDPRADSAMLIGFDSGLEEKGSGGPPYGQQRGVRPVYLRCSQGQVTWLYPTGALRVVLRYATAAAKEFQVRTPCGPPWTPVDPLWTPCGPPPTTTSSISSFLQHPIPPPWTPVDPLLPPYHHLVVLTLWSGLPVESYCPVNTKSSNFLRIS